MTVETGRFITLEGGEGVGKSTQARHLAHRLGEIGIRCVTTREPGGSPHAEKLRRALLAGVVAPFGPAAEAMAFSAARIDHLDKVIGPALARGDWVICDRFVDSTRAYQGAQDALDPLMMRALETVTLAGVWPDLTLILDLPADTGMRRAAARRGNDNADRFEAESAEFHEALRRAFLTIAANNENRCVVIDADQSEEAVARDIWLAVDRKLRPRSWLADVAARQAEP